MKNIQVVTSISDSLPHLQNGGVGVLPTDTVYGLVCRAVDENAVKRLYQIKSRENKPGTVIASSVNQLIDLGIDARYLKAAAKYWPNPISVVIPNYHLKYLHLGKESIAVRIPSDKSLQELLAVTGPLLTSSANTPSSKPAATLTEAQYYFGDTVDFYVDGGDLSNNLPSTIIRISEDSIEVLRPGAVAIDESSGEVIS